MANASIKDIKARMVSVEGTMQITKAMELVATSKLRHAKEKAENAKVFRQVFSETVGSLAGAALFNESAFSGKDRPIKKTLYIVVAGDRGLAGGFNNNVFRTATVTAEKYGGEACYLPVGKKAAEKYKNAEQPFGFVDEVQKMGAKDCYATAENVAEGYLSGKFDRAVIVYTTFTSMMTQIPTAQTVLPLSELGTEKREGSFDPIFEGDVSEMLEKLVPELIGAFLLSATYESLASESAARRAAMNSANKNAEEMIDGLRLSYNRARQAVITQEITEIVSGAEAL